MIDVKRRDAAPASLAANDHYDGEDVVDALYVDFLGKCYLCETKIQVGTFTIDHRKPQGERQFPALRCAWTNLFPTCNTHRCNERRRKLYPEGGLLDPGGNHNLEERLTQRLEHPSAVLTSAKASFVFTAVQKDDAAAVNAAEELTRIHEGTGASPPAQRTAGALRGAILVHVELIARKLIELQGADGDERDARRRDLRALFSRRAPYTMLVRSCFTVSPIARALFDEAAP